MNAARKWLAEKRRVKEIDVEPILAGVEIPDPVFFCSIEPASLVCTYIFLTNFLFIYLSFSSGL